MSTLDAPPDPAETSEQSASEMPAPEQPASEIPASEIPASDQQVLVTYSGRRALTWLDDDSVGPVPTPAQGYPADLLAKRPHRTPLRATVVIPMLAIVALVGAYVAATQLWPLHAVPPEASVVEVAPLAASDTAVAWPATGTAGVGVDGITADAVSTDAVTSIASITKLVTALMVLDESPLAAGESGPTYTFTNADRRSYQGFLARGESALAYPVGGSLTQYQLLQGALIGSAGNYADYLASRYWTTDAVFASAARTWLARHNLAGITVVEPTGIDPENAATPEAVIALGELALANPVVAEIVKTPQVDLPGAGTVANTNDLLADPTVVGLKTGTLDGQYNLLAAKDVTVGETTVRVFATALGQPDDAARDGETQRLLDAVAAEVAAPPVMPAGTRIGVVTTPWGASSDIVTDADIWVVLWNRASASAAPTVDLGEARTAGADVGTLTLTGPLGKATVAAHLTDDLPDPDGWWRLTHPLELFGLVD
ncbi:D-alanyl-D-alanine carboxypeptidase [Microbacterium telephonicum]|uniref:D-alanyl-D-alanine carboxypeptidase (Penicillin-binding protein 5/6) n=1 Tax=Microbacterium telephonicum TaxID=1714841 RepID=A0A498C1F9_9MICO|nr:D-alanyl-D-alanine carboxypeptidase [Microbacterium telephonicum]RLK46668.1 D-alanyl-D-alanine carboxypeptidase (penicillin-binding protein 5/6) [Microbacterium telephonicum]